MARRSCAVQKQIAKQQMREFTLENPQISVQNSIEFMKKLTVIAVSSISYLRNLFPSSAFEERKLEGIRVRILRGIDDIPGTITLINWLKSAFEAVETHYLKKLVLVIQKQDGTILEVYTFSFYYNHEIIRCHIQNEFSAQEITMENQCPELPPDIKKATVQLIRSVLTLTTTLRPLPDGCEVSMRLEFHDNVPDDYELPKCFKAADSLGLSFPSDAHTLKLGKVESRFTTIALTTKASSNWENTEDGDDDELVLSSQNLSNNSVSFRPSAVQNTEHDTFEAPGISDESTHLSGNKVIKCVCECTDEDSKIIKCSSCNNYQHKACYKLMEDQQVERHICVDCHQLNNSMDICTNADLVNDSTLNRKDSALYRRALLLCLDICRVSTNTFVTHFHVPRQNAVKIFEKLVADGCLRPPSGTGNVRTVKINHLKDHIFGLYFGKASIDSYEDMDTEENPLVDKENHRKRKNDQDESSVHEDVSPIAQHKRTKFGTIKENQRKRKNDQDESSVHEDIFPIAQHKRPKFGTIKENNLHVVN